jgi:hypothetical protein
MNGRADVDTGTTAGVIVVAVAGPVLLTMDGPALLRIPIMVLLLGLVPGLAVVRAYARTTDPLSVAILAIALSFALDVVVASTLLYLRAWSVLMAVSVLAAVVLVATAVRHASRRST